MTSRRLIADIGGTNARFAFVEAGQAPMHVTKMAVKNHPTFEAALDTYLDTLPWRPDGMAISAAGPLEDDIVRLTNAPWIVDARRVKAHLNGVPVRIYNDLEAVALGLPNFETADLTCVTAGAPPTEPLPMIAINAGTGLGAAVAIPSGSDWSVLATEGGHARLSSVTECEAALLDAFETFEDVLAGPGLARLRDQLGDHAEVRALYSGLLGRLSGDLVLATGAWGGVFYCGGVLHDWAAIIDETLLLASFQRKGAMTERMQHVPIHRILHETPAFVGLARAPLY